MPVVAVGVVEAAAPQRYIARKPFLAHAKMRREALQEQVKSEQRLVPRPRWLNVNRLQMRIVGNNGFQQLARVFEGS